MERLTERYTATEKPDGESDVWVRDHDYTMAAERLAEYEDTDLTPEQVMELKERNTAKAPEEIQDAFGDGRLICPHCRNSVINYFNRSRPHNGDGTVTISEKVYKELREKAANYEKMVDIVSRAVQEAIKGE